MIPPTETWISVDVETSGPTPSTGSLLSIGACLVERPDEGIELLLRPDADRPWSAEAERIHGLDRARLEREGLDPAEALRRFDAWVAAVTAPGARPVLVALNAPFDWMFVADAAWRHLGRNPFGSSALDVKALHLGVHGPGEAGWAGTSRIRILERHPVALPHTHRALDDAREQAKICRSILAAAPGGGSGGSGAGEDGGSGGAARPDPELLRGALDSSLDGFGVYRAVLDADGRYVDATVVYANEVWKRQYSPGDPAVEGRSIYGFPGARSRFAVHARVAETGIPFRDRVELTTADGPRTLDLQLVRFGGHLVGSSRDITDQRRVEEALAASERRHREMVDELDALVWEEDDATGEGSVGGASLRLTGYGPERWDDPAFWASIVHEEDREHAVAALGGLDDTEVEYRLVRADGEVRWFRDRMRVVREADGRPLRRHGVAIDVTERRELEERLRRSERLSSVGQLAANVAHDVDNVLYGIGIFADRLRRAHPGEGDPARADAEAIEHAVAGAKELTRSLLAFAREQPARDGQVEVDPAIRALAPMLGNLLGGTIVPELSLHADAAVAVGATGAFDQVLVNLALNARDAMPDGGTLRIATRIATLDAEDAAALETEPGRGVVVTVRDTGTGMDAETLARAIEPYFTTKAVGRGTGLGLAAVYGWVTAAGGGFGIESTPGRGTTVTLFLRLATTGTAPAGGAPAR